MSQKIMIIMLKNHHELSTFFQFPKVDAKLWVFCLIRYIFIKLYQRLSEKKKGVQVLSHPGSRYHFTLSRGFFYNIQLVVVDLRFGIVIFLCMEGVYIGIINEGSFRGRNSNNFFNM
eukprot:TRINITY_DN553_c2_g1_i2.p6 TRINITY_DN553_c2_g1~~TRINITY_DN553_c2_g1_i2.p6  ORF type:complete len:117 (-),score=5.49 TRINITY_DN553_c2_g1_i2:157-507(-)